MPLTNQCSALKKSVVVMPTANRPEFLALTLENLSHLPIATDLDVRIFADAVPEARLEEIEFVRDEYFPEALIFRAKPHIKVLSGCWNILNAIKQGYETGAEYIILLEEDICVRPGFYDWHMSQMATGEYLATCGRKDPRFYPRHPDIYTNPGSCLRRDLVAQLIPHINDEYFKRLRGYLDEKFDPWDEMSHLDDGLIRRVIRQMGGKVKFPDEAVCAHKGWAFYNKIDIYMNRGTIKERIARLPDMMAKLKPGDRYASDFEP
jgi:hypothetical protein